MAGKLLQMVHVMVSMRAFKDQHGVALPLALIVLVLLIGTLLVFLSMAGTEPQSASNLTDTTRARYAADAGIEWAFDQLVLDPNWSNFLVTNGGQMATNVVLPGLSAAFGTFSVTVRNDDLPGDSQVTGQPVDPGGPTTDTNTAVILTSAGSYNGVSRQIQQVVTHVSLPSPGALNLPGVGSNTIFSGNSFTISGNDTNLDDTPGAGIPGTCPASVWGIGVRDSATENVVEGSLSRTQKDNVTGKPQGGGPGVGDNTIAPDLALTPAAISQFVNAVKPYANMSLQTSAASRLSVNNLGDTCGTDLSDPNCWGTRSNPKIVYVKGTVDAAQSYYAASISGNSTGAGILIIEDGDLSVTGDFRWEGIIIVTGQYVGVRYGGGGNKTVYGSVIVNETASSEAEVEFDAAGNAKLMYSCQALENVRNMRQLYRLASWREL